jgi:uncharacterized protein (TIGR00725 family)
MSVDFSDLKDRKRVGIIGGNSADLISRDNSFKLGQLIAKSGYVLVNGGMGGVMEASAKGAKSENGLVIGILPGKKANEGNQYIDIAIPTGLGYLRNPILILNCDIIVAIDGSYGTLSEIAYTQIFKKPLFGLNTWNIPGVTPLSSPEKIILQINRYFEKEL